jgi:ribosomal protein S18 acetylase RimI-like enzyme
MHIRQLMLDDYERVVEIWSQAGLPYRPLGRDARTRFQLEVGQKTALFLGAEVGGALVGVVLGTHDGRKGWINRLAVLPEHRRLGIGKALAMEVEQWLNRQGIQIVTCLIESGNAASGAFFESLGYVEHPDIAYYSKRKSADW